MDIRNRLLAACGAPAAAVLFKNISEVSLTVGRILAEPGDRVEQVYFPTSGVVSIVTLLEDGRKVESLTVGREGAVGLLAAFGKSTALQRSIVQIAGAALRIGVEPLRAAAAEHPAILDVVIRYAQFTEAQLHQSAACNAVHNIEARLCRWLLTCQDRTGDHVLSLTQEFLAMMLGVQRTSVTMAAQTLHRHGLIEYRRGRITVLDRAGMEQASCECYRTIEAIYASVFAEDVVKSRP